MTNETNDTTPYFFLVNEQYAMGTPRGIAASGKTIDMPFHDFASNYDLQAKLKLASTVFLRPNVNPPIAYPSKGKELVENVAGFIAAFCDNQVERNQRRDYLVNNGLVRILVSDAQLREELMPRI